MAVTHELPILPALGVASCGPVVQPIQDRAAAALRRFHLRTWDRRMIDSILLDWIYSGAGAALGAVVLFGVMWLADWP